MALTLKERSGYYYAFGTPYRGGPPQRKALGVPVVGAASKSKALAELRRLEAELMDQRGKPKQSAMTVREAAQRYAQNKRQNLQTDPNLHQRIALIVDRWGDTPIASINKAMLEGWVDEWQAERQDEGLEPLLPQTLHRKLSTYYAIRTYVAEELGLPVMSCIQLKGASRPPTRLSEEQMYVLLEWVRTHPRHGFLWPLFTICALAGPRLNEAMGLSGKSVRHLWGGTPPMPVILDIQKSEYRVNGAKGPGKTHPRLVPCHPYLVYCLQQTLRGRRDATRKISLARTGDKWHNATRAAAAAHRCRTDACKALGLPWFHTHDLRATFSKAVGDYGMDSVDTAYLLGHRAGSRGQQEMERFLDLSMTARYRGESMPAILRVFDEWAAHTPINIPAS